MIRDWLAQHHDYVCLSEMTSSSLHKKLTGSCHDIAKALLSWCLATITNLLKTILNWVNKMSARSPDYYIIKTCITIIQTVHYNYVSRLRMIIYFLKEPLQLNIQLLWQTSKSNTEFTMMESNRNLCSGFRQAQQKVAGINQLKPQSPEHRIYNERVEWKSIFWL